MSDAMAGRIFAGFLGNGHSVWWERKMPRTTEYIRADVAQAQLDAANERIAELEALVAQSHTNALLADKKANDAWSEAEQARIIIRRLENRTTKETLREPLADLCHQQWSDWMEYLFSKGALQDDGTWIMPSWAVERWQRQMRSTYAELSEEEKDSDRVEADKFLAIIGGDE